MRGFHKVSATYKSISICTCQLFPEVLVWQENGIINIQLKEPSCRCFRLEGKIKKIGNVHIP
jgi:hypothetical protein